MRWFRVRSFVNSELLCSKRILPLLFNGGRIRGQEESEEEGSEEEGCQEEGRKEEGRKEEDSEEEDRQEEKEGREEEKESSEKETLALVSVIGAADAKRPTSYDEKEPPKIDS